MDEKREIIKDKLSEIEAEMRRVGLWQDEPLPREAYDYTLAFARDTMAFHQWLQFVFIPRVREAIATNQFPTSSHVGTQAVREFDTEPRATHLAALLSEFDALFSGR